MDIKGKSIGGHPLCNIRDAVIAFCDIELTFEQIERGDKKRLDSAILAKLTGLPQDEAESLHALLVAEDYLDGDTLTPTKKGMALSIATDLPRIARGVATEVYKRFLREVESADVDGRAFHIGRVGLFGSLSENESKDVGDIDVFFEIQQLFDHPDFSPETQEEIDELTEKVRISKYLSFHNEFGLPEDVSPEDITHDYVGKFYNPDYLDELSE